VHVELDIPSLKDTFRFLAMADTLFGIKNCGHCDCPDLAYQFKTPQGYEYYSIKCKGCGYEFKFGQQQNDQKTLFPKGWEAPYKKGDGRDDDGDDYESQERPEREERQERSSPPRTSKRDDGIEF
jgi:hypothetical protein